MGLFNKIQNGANRMFRKVGNTLRDPNLFGKVNGFAKIIDKQVQKMGGFILPGLTAFNPGFGAALASGMAASSALRNGLERTTPKLRDIASIAGVNYN